MRTIIEEGLEFTFTEEWEASQFDQWSFYRGQFARFGDAEIVCTKEGCRGVAQCGVCNARRIAGNRGVDILAIGPNSVCWLIEIKDYRKTRVTNFAFLADEVALKVRDTLSCLVAAQRNANLEAEKTQAVQALRCSSMRVVLHLEVPPSNRPLSPANTQRARALHEWFAHSSTPESPTSLTRHRVGDLRECTRWRVGLVGRPVPAHLSSVLDPRALHDSPKIAGRSRLLQAAGQGCPRRRGLRPPTVCNPNAKRSSKSGKSRRLRNRPGRGSRVDGPEVGAVI